MGTRWIGCFSLIVFITLLGSVAQARMSRKTARRPAESVSAQVAVARLDKGKPTARRNWRGRGQQAIASKRVREIQAALVREDYLKGRPNGVWDQRSKQAMARFQKDNHWQSRVVPDSRALIKLGLGPDHTGLINPETAAISFIPGGGTGTTGSTLRR